MEQKLRAALQAIQGVKIPDLPKEVLELDAVLASKFPNNQTIVSIIESNTKLSGEVMRIVNSPVMKLKVPVKSIREAVDILGSNNLKNLVLASALKNLFGTPEVIEIIDHAKDIAFCCAELSEYIQGVSRDEAYLVGLFHNAGCLLLASKDPENYPKLFHKVHANPYSGLALEVTAYGSSHNDIGILIGKKWQLPFEMLNVIMLHHREPAAVHNDKIRAMNSMIQLANVVVNEVSMGAYITDEARRYLAEAQEDLMLDNNVVNSIRNALIMFS
jgi:HD-like signal output (HDOD) protein